MISRGPGRQVRNIAQSILRKPFQKGVTSLLVASIYEPFQNCWGEFIRVVRWQVHANLQHAQFIGLPVMLALRPWASLTPFKSVWFSWHL